MAVPTQPVDGMFFDELSKIRVLEPDTAERTQELKDECKEFVDSEALSLINAHPKQDYCTAAYSNTNHTLFCLP